MIVLLLLIVLSQTAPQVEPPPVGVAGVGPSVADPSVIPPAGRAVSGTATWCAPTPRYCHGWGGNAHLGAVASFRWGDEPYFVQVTSGGRSTVVQVVSYCACGPTLIDLSPAAFRELAPLSRGRIQVVVRRLDGHLPATDTEAKP